MATMTPDATISNIGATLTGDATVHACLDASGSSYINLEEVSGHGVIVSLSTSGGAADQYVECTLACDASCSAADGARIVAQPYTPVPVWVPPGGPYPHGCRISSHGESGAFAAMYADAGYTASVRYKLADAEALRIFLLSVQVPSGPNRVAANNLRVTTSLVSGPTTTVLTPAGTVAGTRPPVTWTTTATVARAWDLRVYTQAVYGSGGFDPGNPAFTAIYSKSVSDVPPYAGYSGDPTRPWALTRWTIGVHLPIGNYRVYVRTADTPTYMLGEYNLFGPWAFSAFTIVDLPPEAGAPLVPVNISSTVTPRSLLWSSHEMRTQAVLYSPDGSSSHVLDVVAGSVRYDATSKTRAQATLEVADIDMVPSGTVPFDPNQYLHPFGSYVHISRGIGDSLVGLGVFRLDTVKVARGDTPGTVRITASDFGAFLDDARFTFDRTRQDWTTGTAVPQKVTDVAAAIVAEAGLAFVLGGSSSAVVVVNYTNKQTESRLDALADLATELGWVTFALDEAYALGAPGAIYFGPDIDPAAVAAASFVEGDNATLITNADYVLDRKDVYDLAVAYSPDGLYVSAAFDGNPASPIRRGAGGVLAPVEGAGPFSPGGKPIFFSSPVVVSQATADAAARTVFSDNVRLLQPIQLAGVVDPSLRPSMGIDLLLYGETLPTRLRVVQVVVPLGPAETMNITATSLVSFVQAAN